MDAVTAVNEAMAKAKRQAIIDRLLEWIDRAATVEIVREQPGMERPDSYITSRLVANGELTIELKLTGIVNIDVGMFDSMKHREPDNYFAK